MSLYKQLKKRPALVIRNSTTIKRVIEDYIIEIESFTKNSKY